MASNQSYFSHDSNARNSDKLIKVRMDLGAEGYGIYFMILERLREEDNYKSKKDYKMIAFDLRVEVEKVEQVIINYDLFVIEDDVFYSNSFLERMTIKDSKRLKAQKAVNERWEKEKGKKEQEKYGCNTDVLHPYNECNTDLYKEKKRKVKKNKVKKIQTIAVTLLVQSEEYALLLLSLWSLKNTEKTNVCRILSGTLQSCVKPLKSHLQSEPQRYY